MALVDNVSARHQELIAGIIKNLGNAEINWEAVAKDANFSSAKYAKDEYRKVRKTLDSVDGSGATANGAAAKKKASPKKRKNDDEDETGTPKTKKESKKNASSSEEDGEKDSEDVKAEADSDDGDMV
ncbi:hypothetical protein M409DRAFT_24774 [Zasmidium cellare ATCC 36951]|uniref:Myb-like domain-containing protein n=1 Tax=Zasmidium cellare ATCC 36951 TaxID=1080233 RepID=A0A6A6CGR8_ZASCE|nr:uncharacterized protein M409DRAFT_24774 [Zasmidium cellare ATCC 36951]KAF2164869.1 hypothetical protein M409DRAFT_24774 [Zasmidium cellare ATCC 36951]